MAALGAIDSGQTGSLGPAGEKDCIMALHVTDHRKGFAPGLTEITRFEDPGEPTGLSFAVLKLAAGETTKIETKHETA